MLVLRAARLFDGERMVEPPVLLVEGERIAAAGGGVPEGAPVVDLGAATLLPGLVDTHQHLCFDGHGGLEEQVGGIADDRLLARARECARRALLGGVTTLRDLGDRGFLALSLRGDRSLPTILAAGPPITSPRGHCWYLGGECSGDDAIRRAVSTRVEMGCDVIKVMVSGGYLTATVPMWESQFTIDELRLVVDLAHAHGLPVAAHCHGIEAITHAINTRVDTIEHCTFFTHRGRAEPPDALVERLATSGVVVSATLGRLPDVPLPPLAEANLPVLRETRRRLHRLGATIVAGTDAGINEGKPHDVLPYAMTEHLDAGMTPIEALRALTSLAARALAVDARKGRLAAGCDADLVAVAGDPLVDPAALTSVVGVWRGGERVR
jgi:imidazolonepropionase-like amidohydrolase